MAQNKIYINSIECRDTKNPNKKSILAQARLDSGTKWHGKVEVWNLTENKMIFEKDKVFGENRETTILHQEMELDPQMMYNVRLKERYSGQGFYDAAAGIPASKPNIISAEIDLKSTQAETMSHQREVKATIEYDSSPPLYTKELMAFAFLRTDNWSDSKWNHPYHISYYPHIKAYVKTSIFNGENFKKTKGRCDNSDTTPPSKRETTYIGPEGKEFKLSFIFPELNITDISYNEGEVTVKWKVDNSILSGTFCEVNLEENGKSVIVPSPSAPYSSGKLVIPHKFEETSHISVNARLGYADSEEFGEWGKPVILIFNKPDLTGVECKKEEEDQNSLEIKWENNGHIDNLKINVCIKSGDRIIKQQKFNAKEKKAKLNKIKFDSYKSYDVSIRYCIDESNGPESEKAPIIHKIPEKFAFDYFEQEENQEEAVLKAVWDKIDQETVYELEISRNDIFDNPVETNEASQTIGNESVNSGIVIAGKIRGKKDISTGPWSHITPAPFACDNNYKFDSLGRLLETDTDKKQKLNFTYDELGNILEKKVTVKDVQNKSEAGKSKKQTKVKETVL